MFCWPDGSSCDLIYTDRYNEIPTIESLSYPIHVLMNSSNLQMCAEYMTMV